MIVSKHVKKNFQADRCQLLLVPHTNSKLQTHYNLHTPTLKIQPTWKILAPYGVLQAFNKLSFPVLTNHFPQYANLSESTQLSWR